MKVRNGFVSNSSSSSFILYKDKLTEDQILLIKNHHLCKTIPCADTDFWSVNERNDTLELFTMQDSFDMYEYLTQIVKIPYNSIKDSSHFIYKEDFEDKNDSEAERILKEVKGDNYED